MIECVSTTAVPRPLAGHMNWDLNWIWSLPLIVVTMTIQVLGLGYIATKLILDSTIPSGRSEFLLVFCRVVGTTTLFATLLLTVHAIAWALLYLALGALPD